MANIGDRFKTGQRCEDSGVYDFDGYTDGTSYPAPTEEEKQINLTKGETFPPISSADKGCWWKLTRKQ